MKSPTKKRLVRYEWCCVQVCESRQSAEAWARIRKDYGLGVYVKQLPARKGGSP